MSGALADLANLAVTDVGLKGVDWAALTAAGRGSVWDRDYITQYMVPAQQRMTTVLAGLDLNIVSNPVDFTDNYTINEDVLIDVAQAVVSLGNPVGIVAMKVEARLSREAIRYLTVYAAQCANFGLLLHQDETIHHSGKSDQEIASHADVIVGLMNCIAILNAAELYSMLGITNAAPASTSGLGVAPAVLIVIVAVVAILAWVVVNLRTASEINNTVATMCAKAQAAGDAATTQLCVNTLTSAAKDVGTLIPPGTIEGILKTVLPYALAGVGVYMLFLFAPTIVKSLTTSRAATS
jgi:hypothetical protein